MKYEHKLDILQEMVITCASDPAKEYLIGVLVEHAEEAEMTAEFLERIAELLKK